MADERMDWVKDVGIQRARIAGFSEVAVAVGLIIIGLLGILEILTPLAAFTVHQPRHEQQVMMVNCVLGLLALTVAAGRFIETL